MTNLVPYRARSPLLRERRAVAEVRESQRPARRAAARLDAAAIVTQRALQSVEVLTAVELEVRRRQGPVIDERARSIVDSFVVLANNEIIGLSLRGE